MLLAGAGPSSAQWLANPLRRLLRADTAGMARVLARPGAYRLQILYTRIRRDVAGRPHFRSYRYRLRPREYFYPASAVKLAAAALALEKMRDINRLKLEAFHGHTPPIGPDSPMLTDSAFAGQTRVLRDTSSASGRPSLANYVRKALLVSDNDAFNRLYEFVGPAELNAGLARLGLHRSRLLHRLSVGDQEPASRHTNPIAFYADTAATQLLYQQPAAFYGGPGPSRACAANVSARPTCKVPSACPARWISARKTRFRCPTCSGCSGPCSFPKPYRPPAACAWPPTTTPCCARRFRNCPAKAPTPASTPRTTPTPTPSSCWVGVAPRRCRQACACSTKSARPTAFLSIMPTSRTKRKEWNSCSAP
ncbi:serine hydrolase [Hymenobacter humi]|uniref:Serine hydrolase n=1 Tax=Hymenobacter humi TaxID=1411620 RepID=A0ABW2U3Z8_9BACT